MKTVFLSFLTVLCSVNAALAGEVVYDCGQPYGKPITLMVQSAEGSRYSHVATFEAPGVDKKSGMMVRSVKMRLEGSKEPDGEGGAYFLLHDPNDPAHQVIAEIKKKGESAEVVELKEVLSKKPKQTSYACTIK